MNSAEQRLQRERSEISSTFKPKKKKKTISTNLFTYCQYVNREENIFRCFGIQAFAFACNFKLAHEKYTLWHTPKKKIINVLIHKQIYYYLIEIES